MSIFASLKDAVTGTAARITDVGEVVCSPYAYSETSVNVMSATGTAYNFITPKSGYDIIITGLFLYADRNVSNTNEATIELYEATAVDEDTVDVAKITLNAIKQQSLQLNPLNLICNSGKWINAKTDDATINMTVFYYYIPINGGVVS